MRHRPRAGDALILAAGALALGGATSPAASAASDVTVTVTGLRSAKGVVRACMTADSARFPKCAGDPHSHRIVVPAATSLKLTFKGVTPGHYAIALLHDENNNGKADRALGMMPKEGFGFSRDAPVRMAPPKYADAVFDIDGKNTAMTIKMRYML